MGLDMYLNAKKYLSSFKDKDIATREAIKEMKLDWVGDMEPIEVSFRAMYWRKANHIHKWFVDNVQDGEDECRPHSVSTEKLKELLDVCKQVLEDRGLASELLPVQAGFFFGGTEYDDWYFGDVEDTIKGLEKILSIEGVELLDFEYQSSW